MGREERSNRLASILSAPGPGTIVSSQSLSPSDSGMDEQDREGQQRGDKPAQQKLVTKIPGHGRIAFGEALQSLSQQLASETSQAAGSGASAMDIHRFGQDQLRYLDPACLQKLTCAEAIQQWAAQRLPSLNVEYNLLNRIQRQQVSANQDRGISQQLVLLAEDFMLISKFCRHLRHTSITISPNPNGIHFFIVNAGRCDRAEMRLVEDKGFNVLMEKYVKESGFKVQITGSDHSVQMSALALKPKARMGITPKK